MFLGGIDQFIVYNEGEFACPKCHFIHFEKTWRPFYKADFEKFEMRCKNSNCYTHLVAMRFDNYMFVTEKKIETFLYKTQKIQMLMKRIDVEAHVKRYEGVDINDKLALIEALKKMIEVDRVKMVEDMKEKLAQLEKGEIPASDTVAESIPKRTRKPKVTKEIAEDHQDADTVGDDVNSDEL